jgi:hypothetical protein
LASICVQDIDLKCCLKAVCIKYVNGLACFTGKAEGVLFEDAGDGYTFTQGDYLLTYYIAELHSSVVIVKVLKSEGSWKRPKRNLKINILLGGGAMVCLLAFIIFIQSINELIFNTTFFFPSR